MTALFSNEYILGGVIVGLIIFGGWVAKKTGNLPLVGKKSNKDA